jgi:hypothetical protein
MQSLASLTDFEAHLGRTLAASELDRAEALLADASTMIRHYTGQNFDYATTTDMLWIRRQTVLLPQRIVHDVASVLDRNGNPITYDWLGPGADTLYVLWPSNELTSFYPLVPHAPPVAVVTYTHGYTDNPPDVIGVTCSVALRAFGLNPLATGHHSETIEGYSYVLTSVAAAGATGLLAEEKRTLDQYRALVAFIDGPRL